MRLLLDTHVFLWYVTAAPRLPASFEAAIREPANEVYITHSKVPCPDLNYVQEEEVGAEWQGSG